MKRIITCSDGTWNQPGLFDRGIPVETNVLKMFKCIAPVGKDSAGNDVRQLKVYDQGVGTGVTRRDRIIGGMTGAGIDKNIKDIYTFICLNYKPGDDIFLFGFSRGAYTARSIGGLIRNCGVLKPEHIQLVDMAYNLYRDRNSYSHPESDLMTSFRAKYCYEDLTRIKFIGVWDTVGALGVPLRSFLKDNMRKYHFHDVTLGSSVDYAYHALAIDEKRGLFSPTLWKKSKSVMADKNSKQVLEQRWFAGAHSNVGGGYADSGLSNIALQWLIDKATSPELLLKLNEPYYNVADYDKGELRNSFTAMYTFTFSPKKIRDIDLNDLASNQTIDESVWARYDKDSGYRPKGLAPWLNKREKAK